MIQSHKRNWTCSTPHGKGLNTSLNKSPVQLTDRNFNEQLYDRSKVTQNQNRSIKLFCKRIYDRSKVTQNQNRSIKLFCKRNLRSVKVTQNQNRSVTFFLKEIYDRSILHKKHNQIRSIAVLYLRIKRLIGFSG